MRLIRKYHYKLLYILEFLCKSFYSCFKWLFCGISTFLHFASVCWPMLNIFFLFRRKAEDVGVRRGGWCFCPPGICSVNDLPRMVRKTTLSFRFIITRFIFSFTPCIRLVLFFFNSHPTLIHASLAVMSSSYCAIRRSLETPDSANGTVVWMGQDAHELTYTCPECQQPSQESRAS